MARGKKAAATLTPEEKLQQALVPVEEQPYEIPENWCYIPQQVICQLSNGEKMDDKQYPYLEVKYLRGNKDAEIVNSGKFIPAYSRVILVDGENSGEVFTVLEDGYMGSTFKALEISQAVLPEYLQYFISTKKELYRNNKKGSAIPHLNKDMFFTTAFPLAPLAEQQRIVDCVESIFAKLNEAKEKVQAVVDGFELRKSAILHKAFTGELTTQWRQEHGVGLESWNTAFYCDLGTSKLGKMLDKAKNTGIETPYLRNINVRWFSFDLSDIANMLATDEERESLSVKKGDLFICEGGEPGRCAIWKDDDSNLIFQKALHRFRPNEKVLSEFLCYNLYYMSLSDELEKYFTGTTIKHLTGKSLAQIQIKIPTICEQSEIIRNYICLFDYLFISS